MLYDGYHATPKLKSIQNFDIPTLNEAYTYFKSMKPNLASRTIETYDQQILGRLDDWLNISLNDITKTMISEKHKQISKSSPAQENATMRALRSIWNYCQDSFLDDDEEYIIKDQPVRILNAKNDWNKIKPRIRHVEEEYLGVYFKTLIEHRDGSSFKQASYSNNARDILLLFMFAGVRLNEAQTLRWEDVDFDAARIVFKATKNGSDYHMPTGKILQAILSERYRLSDGECWVFPSDLKRNSDHVKDLSGSYHSISNKAGLHITPHDLRRTFGTVANSLNVTYPVLKRLLNHREAKSSDDVTLHYIQVSQRQLREALDEIEAFYCKRIGMTQNEVIKSLLQT